MGRIHFMVFVVIAAALVAVGTARAAAPASASTKPSAPKIRLLLLSGANNHDWKTTTPALKKIYEKSGYFSVDVSENVPALKAADFAKYDCIVSNYTTFPNTKGHRWPAETEKAFLDYIAAGHGFVTFHAGSTTWSDWPAFGDLIGLTWQTNISLHGNYHSFAVTVTDDKHPITRGMKSFQHVSDELYHRQLKHPTARVLATAYSARNMHGTGQFEPMIAVTKFGKGRCFYNAMGHDVRAISGVCWQTLMLRGTQWATTGKVTIAIPADWPPPVPSPELKSERK
jgi:type 1 glutamine amidotransferase